MFSERTEESSAVQYFQVSWHLPWDRQAPGVSLPSLPTGGHAAQGRPTQVLILALSLTSCVASVSSSVKPRASGV